jgi:phage terminase small subunit
VSEGLTNKQSAFVEAYLACGFNASEAARQAGYAKPGQQGHRLLKNVEIAAAIQQGLTERAMPATEVLARIAEHARGTMDDFLDDAGDIDLTRARERGRLHLVKSRSVTKEGERIELYDAQSALALLAKHHGLLVERVDLNDITDYADVSPDEKIARLGAEIDRLKAFAAWDRAALGSADAEPDVAGGSST